MDPLTILGGVITIVIGAALIGAAQWLRSEQHRDDLRDKLRQAVCRHDWRPLETSGPNWIYVTGHTEQCRKCGAER